ncbi:hypothetical protein Tco_1424223, partial [Tanacetum coccineum]
GIVNGSVSAATPTFENEVANRMRHFRGDDSSSLDLETVRVLIGFLDEHNELVRLFRTSKDKFRDGNIPSFKIRLYSIVGAQWISTKNQQVAFVIYVASIFVVICLCYTNNLTKSLLTPKVMNRMCEDNVTVRAASTNGGVSRATTINRKDVPLETTDAYEKQVFMDGKKLFVSNWRQSRILKKKKRLGENKKGSSFGGSLLSEESLASFYSHTRCAGSLGEEKQASPAYLPSISIGDNGKSCQSLAALSHFYFSWGIAIGRNAQYTT